MKKIILFVFAFLTVTNLYAQDSTGLPFITAYSPMKTGVYGGGWSILQGDNGIMYFGTGSTINNTLAEYDGVNWTVIPNMHVKQGTSGLTRCMAKDGSGTIFYGGTGNFGYLAHDSTGQTTYVSLLQYVPRDKRDFADIWSVRVAGNSVYFQAMERLFRLTKRGSGKNVTWICKTWDPKTRFQQTFYLNHTLYVKEGKTGLLKLINDSLQLIEGSRFLGRMRVMLPYPDTSGKREYLLGTVTGKLYLFDGTQFTPFHTGADKYLKGNVLYCAVRLDNNYALGVMGFGIIIMNPQGKVLQVINKKSGLTSNSSLSLYWDGDHNLWMGSDNGICKVELHVPFTRFFNQPGFSALVLSMARMPDGSLYAGTESEVAKYNPATSRFERVHSVPSAQMFSMIPDGNKLLVGARGLYEIQGSKTLLAQHGLTTYRMLISKRYPNVLYAITFPNGLAVFIRDKNHIGGWRYVGMVPGTSVPYLRWMAEQPDGKLWVTEFHSNALFRITPYFDKNGMPDPARMKVEKFQVGKDFKKNMRAFPFKNKIFFFSDSSTYTFNEAKQKFVKDTVLLAAGDTLTRASPGMNGIFWAVSRKGKYVYLNSSETDQRYRIDTSALLPIDDDIIMPEMVGNLRRFPDKNGIVWYRSFKGLIRYNTNEQNYDTLSFNVLIRKVTSGKTALDPLASSTGNTPEIKFSHHTFRFDYAAPYFLNEDKTQYKTRLEGFDTAWSKWGRNTYKEYTNLTNGHYIFQVRAKNVYGITGREAAYSFIILPPWYRTWWAYIIYAIIVIAIVWGLIAYRSRNLKRKNQLLEQKVSSRTNELQQSLENLKSTQKQLIQSEKMASLGELTAGIAHEIQNPLNFVNNFSEVNTELIDELKAERLKQKAERDEQNEDDIINDIKENSEKIIHHGKRADAIVKGMLEHSRVSSGKKEPTNVNALADEYLRLSYHGMRAKDKTFNATMKTDFDETIGKINIVPQDIGRVLLNLFNNAFYACAERSRSIVSQKQKAESEKQNEEGKTYKPTVWVSTKRIAGDTSPLGRPVGAVEIRVRDNGNGIPEKVKDKIFQPFFTTKPTGEGTGLGLSLSYDIIKAHDGEITVNSKEDEGTEFVVTLLV